MMLRLGNKLAYGIPSLAGLSGYEMGLGYLPAMGLTVAHLGGGKPVRLEVFSKETLLAHQISRGEFSQSALRKQGFQDDRHFDPEIHGFYDVMNPKSALQHALWQLTKEQAYASDSILRY